MQLNWKELLSLLGENEDCLGWGSGDGSRLCKQETSAKLFPREESKVEQIETLEKLTHLSGCYSAAFLSCSKPEIIQHQLSLRHQS